MLSWGGFQKTSKCVSAWSDFQMNSKVMSAWSGCCWWMVAVAVGRALEGCSGVRTQGEPLRSPPGASHSDGVAVRAGVRSQLGRAVHSCTAFSKNVKEKFGFNVPLAAPPQLLSDFPLFHSHICRVSLQPSSLAF